MAIQAIIVPDATERFSIRRAVRLLAAKVVAVVHQLESYYLAIQPSSSGVRPINTQWPRKTRSRGLGVSGLALAPLSPAVKVIDCFLTYTGSVHLFQALPQGR